MKIRQILTCFAVFAAVGCSDDGVDERITNPTPNNEGFVDEVPLCKAETRDYDAAPGRYPWAGEERFYRLNGDEFCNTTGEILLDVKEAEPLEDVKAIISPHAGWQFSGIVTATMLSRINVPDLVILIGNNHRDNGESFAVYPSGLWSFPNGDVPVDEEVAASLIEGVPDLVGDTVAHSEEHSIEVQVMWLTRFNPNVRIVPIAVDYTSDVEKLKTLGTEIASVLKGLDQEYLVIGTTDLTHYRPIDEVNERDDAMVAPMVAMDPDGLFNLVHPERSKYSMCGMEPSVVTMQVATELGATGGELIMRRTSADRNNNNEQAVGYAGVVYR